MLETPIIKAVNSDTYGTYWMECVGIVDYLRIAREFELDVSCDWLSDFHPVRYFRSFCLQKLHTHLGADGKPLHADRLAVYVPTPRVNTQWNIKDSEYGKTVSGRKRVMPLASANTEKRIRKWQQSLPGEVLVPSWLVHCRSDSDVIAADLEHNPAKCMLCG